MKLHALARAMLECAAFPLSASRMWAVENFTPVEILPAVAATTTSASASFTLAQSMRFPDVKVCNLGSTQVYFCCGNSLVMPSVPTAESTTATSLGSKRIAGRSTGFTRASAVLARILPGHKLPASQSQQIGSLPAYGRLAAASVLALPSCRRKLVSLISTSFSLTLCPIINTVAVCIPRRFVRAREHATLCQVRAAVGRTLDCADH